MITWIVIIILFSICIFLLIVRGTKGSSHTLETIKRPIEDLLTRGYNGGFLIIDISRSKFFLQLRKYILKPSDYGIELSFPKAKWSEDDFDSLIIFCDRNNIVYHISAEEYKQTSLEFLYVDFGKNSQKAHDCVKRILVEVFGFNEDVKLFVRLENATVEDKLIDR